MPSASENDCEQDAKDSLSLASVVESEEKTVAALVASCFLETLMRDERKMDYWKLVGGFPNDCSNSS